MSELSFKIRSIWQLRQFRLGLAVDKAGRLFYRLWVFTLFFWGGVGSLFSFLFFLLNDPFMSEPGTRAVKGERKNPARQRRRPRDSDACRCRRCFHRHRLRPSFFFQPPPPPPRRRRRRLLLRRRRLRSCIENRCVPGALSVEMKLDPVASLLFNLHFFVPLSRRSFFSTKKISSRLLFYLPLSSVDLLNENYRDEL